jgi:hypothetical protein
MDRLDARIRQYYCSLLDDVPWELVACSGDSSARSRAQDRSRAPWWPSACPNAVTQHAGSLEAIMRELLISEFQDRRTTLSL